MKLKWLSNVRPIEALMVGWTALAFVAIPLWQSTWTMPTMVVLLFAALIVGYLLEPR